MDLANLAKTPEVSLPEGCVSPQLAVVYCSGMTDSDRAVTYYTSRGYAHLLQLSLISDSSRSINPDQTPRLLLKLPDHVVSFGWRAQSLR